MGNSVARIMIDPDGSWQTMEDPQLWQLGKSWAEFHCRQPDLVRGWNWDPFEVQMDGLVLCYVSEYADNCWYMLYACRISDVTSKKPFATLQHSRLAGRLAQDRCARCSHIHDCVDHSSRSNDFETFSSPLWDVFFTWRFQLRGGPRHIFQGRSTTKPIIHPIYAWCPVTIDRTSQWWFVHPPSKPKNSPKHQPLWDLISPSTHHSLFFRQVSMLVHSC